MTISGRQVPWVRLIRYKPGRPGSRQIHPWVTEFETKVIRGDACARAALQLNAGGFKPDVMIVNPGWGESLYLKDVWPDVPMLALIEYFYRKQGGGFNFDPEFMRTSLPDYARVRTSSAFLLMTLDAMDWGMSPTQFQKSTVPAVYHDRISVVFEGIDTAAARPDPLASLDIGGRSLKFGDEVVTLVNRNLGPARGYHTFMRALPEILRRRPNAVAVIVGGDEDKYSPLPPRGKTWREVYLDEVRDRLDLGRVFFLGKIPYSQYLRVLQVSACHVYLTYPFTLGWSCIEALSSGALVVGSATAPVQEAITHGQNGLLVDFFDHAALAETVTDCLARPDHFAFLRAAARQSAIERYDLATVCLPQQLRLVESLASGKCSTFHPLTQT